MYLPPTVTPPEFKCVGLANDLLVWGLNFRNVKTMTEPKQTQFIVMQLESKVKTKNVMSSSSMGTMTFIGVTALFRAYDRYGVAYSVFKSGDPDQRMMPGFSVDGKEWVSNFGCCDSDPKDYYVESIARNPQQN